MDGIASKLSAATVIAILVLSAISCDRAQSSVPDPVRPHSVRLYVFDCGTIHIGDLSRFRMAKEDLTTTDLAVACFLVVHPKGTLIWDVGAVPDGDWKPTGAPVQHHVILPRPEERGFGHITVVKTLASQLAEVGYAPTDITYLALSHYHYDHTANANLFASAKWLVRPVEREAMFASDPPAVTQPSSYERLRESRTILLESPDYDVFRDSTVIIKSAPGHTPGHQVLYVKLAHTGSIVLSGDLYHYAQSRTLQRIPTFDFDQAQSAASRASIETFLKTSGAQLWIQHDFASDARLRKAPEFYD